MRLMPILLMLIICLPTISASITITSELKQEYNLGDNIDVSLKITPTITTDALVKLTLKCTNKEMGYYVAPISLEKDKETEIKAPSIKASSEGLCTIRTNMESLEGENIDGITSKEFTISDKLDLSTSIDKTEALPGDTIKIQGTVNKKQGNLENANIIIILDEKRYSIGLNEREFSYNLKLETNIKSGEHIVTIEANDQYGNFNTDSKKMNIQAIPTKLEFILNKKEFKPKEELKLTVNLLDQANDTLQRNVNVKLSKKGILFQNDIIIFDKQIEANKEFDFIFNQTTPPNDYTLKSTFEDLEREDIIKILPNEEIETKLEGTIVSIKNIGNVEYNKETTIILEKDDKTYSVNKKIKLDVGEETKIDLSREVPSGTYTVTLPPDTVIQEKILEKEVPTYTEKEEETKESEENVEVQKQTSNTIENVEIKDNRPFYKKRGVGFVTGAVVAGAGLFLKRPKVASLTMIVILLSTVGFFSRKKIERIIESIRKKRSGKY